MTFGNPAAFWGLAALAVPLLLSFWRRRPRPVPVPSVRLWKRVPDRVPPVRSLRTPRMNLLLLVQVLAIAAAVTGAAAPAAVRVEPAPRRIAVVVDTSPAMEARREAVARELAKLSARDEVAIFDSVSLRRGHSAPAAGTTRRDPATALSFAVSEAPIVIWISDRPSGWTPPAGVRYIEALVGGPLANVGIVDANVDGSKLFVRLSVQAPLTAKVDGLAKSLAAAETFLIPLPADAQAIDLSVPADAFPADDRVILKREAGPVDVAMEGRPDPSIRAAVRACPWARWVTSPNPKVLIRVGADPGPAEADVVVDVDPRTGLVSRWGPPGRISVSDAGFARSIPAEEVVVREVGVLEDPWDRPVLASDGAPFAASDREGKRWVVAARFGPQDWPVHPSFPIFWARLLESAAGGGGWKAEGLLDAESSRPGMERRPLEPSALGEPPRKARRHDLVPGFLTAAAILLVAAWILENRTA